MIAWHEMLLQRQLSLIVKDLQRVLGSDGCKDNMEIPELRH
jgi:hypothetical protein